MANNISAFDATVEIVKVAASNIDNPNFVTGKSLAEFAQTVFLKLKELQNS